MFQLVIRRAKRKVPAIATLPGLCNTPSSRAWFQLYHPTFATTAAKAISTTAATATANPNPIAMNYPRAPGLFGLEGLIAPNDFNALTQNAIATINALMKTIADNDLKRRASKTTVPWTYDEAERLLDDLDCISYTLCDVVDTAELVRQSHASPEFRASAENIYHDLSDLLAKLSSSKDLYWSIRSLTDDTEFFQQEMNNEQQRMATMLQREFERDGIHMDETEQDKVMHIKNKITRLETKFVQIANGQLMPTNEERATHQQQYPDHPDHVVASRSALSFMPNHLLQHFPKAPSNNLLNADDSVIVPVATYYGGDEIVDACNAWCPDRALRATVFQTKHHKNMEQNQRSLAALNELLQARQALSHLLGFNSYADMQIRKEERMITSKEKVVDFLKRTRMLLEPEINREKSLLERELTTGRDVQQETDPLQLWDLVYCSSKARRRVQRERHPTLQQPETECMQYFHVDNIIDGLGVVCESLFGVSLIEIPVEQWKNTPEDWVDAPTHAMHGARKIEAHHETEGHIGTVYLDLYPREGKYHGAGHFVSKCGHALPGGGSNGSNGNNGNNGNNGTEDTFQLPVVALLMNFSPPPTGSRVDSNTAALLSHHEVETMFHEFGHALHSLFSRTRYQHLSGTRTLLDFVEVPSHVFEHFVWDHRVLSKFAKHCTTGETIPLELVERMNEQRKIFWGIETDQQLVLSLLDQHIHAEDGVATEAQPTTSTTSTTEVLYQVQQEHSSVPPFKDLATHSRFTHFVGYGCGYYSYLYAKVVSAHIWGECFESNPLCRHAGELYRQELLKYGGGKDPNEILRDLLDVDESPDIEALVDSYIGLRKGDHLDL